MPWNPFAQRPERSVLIQCGAGEFRIDFIRRGNAFVVRRIHAPPVRAELSDDWITPLLKGGPRPAREVIILSDSVRLLLSELPETPSATQLSEILALEAEQLSGLSAADTTVAHIPLPSFEGMPRYLLGHLPWEQLLTWRNQVKAAGGRLLQVGHPGGFSIHEEGAQEERWSRVHLIVQRTGTGKDFTLSESLAETAGDWSEGAEPERLRLDGESPSTPPDDENQAPNQIHLGDPEERRIWAEAVGRSLRTMDGQLSGIPLISVPLPPVGREQQIKIGVAAAVAAGLLVFGHSQLIQMQEKQLEEELASLRQPRQELAELERERNQLRRDLRNLQATPRTETGMNLFARAPALHQLFAGLATHNDPEAALLKIEAHQGQLHLRGLALAPDAPGRFVEAINNTAEEPWRAQLRQRRATFRQNNGGPWEFLIVYEERPSRETR